MSVCAFCLEVVEKTVSSTCPECFVCLSCSKDYLGPSLCSHQRVLILDDTDDQTSLKDILKLKEKIESLREKELSLQSEISTKQFTLSQGEDDYFCRYTAP
jgi:hypothetical protein